MGKIDMKHLQCCMPMAIWHSFSLDGHYRIFRAMNTLTNYHRLEVKPKMELSMSYDIRSLKESSIFKANRATISRRRLSEIFAKLCAARVFFILNFSLNPLFLYPGRKRLHILQYEATWILPHLTPSRLPF